MEVKTWRSGKAAEGAGTSEERRTERGQVEPSAARKGSVGARAGESEIVSGWSRVCG